MCRYANPSYRSNIVCTHCRIGWKGPRQAFYPENGSLQCSRCGREGVDMGRDFHVPRKNRTSQWKKVESFIESGLRFDSCGCSGPGAAPQTLAQEKVRRRRPGRKPPKRALLAMGVEERARLASASHGE